jgi:hypothetical protein
MSQEHSHSTGKLAFLAFTHVFDLIGQVFEVQFGKSPGAQEAGLLLRP